VKCKKEPRKTQGVSKSPIKTQGPQKEPKNPRFDRKPKILGENSRSGNAAQRHLIVDSYSVQSWTSALSLLPIIRPSH